MWDYNKLFAESNVVGLKNVHNNRIYNHGVSHTAYWGDDNEVNWYTFENDELKTNGFEIQYIIRLDEHGNIVEKLFDRGKDMPKPMPELEIGMFVRINNSTQDENHLGFIDAENNHIIYQDGGYDIIDDDEFGPGVARYIVEVYSKDTCAFGYCCDNFLIWRSPDYQAYLNLKSN